MVWFDANRVWAAIGVVLIHSTTNFAGQPFPDASVSERIVPVFLRSLGEFSGSEMFFIFSLFLMAMRVDKKMPEYNTAISQQAVRLLVPFAFWAFFYAFFRLMKADAFGYAPYIWDQLSHWQNWVSYFVLGKSQYHMHFLPTLFILFLFYPVMRLATRYPILGLAIFATLGAMNSAQAYLWGLDIDPLLRDYLVRAVKIMGYVGYGFAAFALYGLWNDGIPKGESRLIRRGGIYFAAMAYVATIPFFGSAIETGTWAVRTGWNFYGHFLMPLFMFCLFVGAQHMKWSPIWSKLARYTFGIYLVHPMVIDIFDVVLFKTGTPGSMDPWMIVTLRYVFALPASLGVTIALSRLTLTAWTIGLGPNPWEWRRAAQKATV